MELKNLTPVLLVRDAKKSMEFYTRVLGLTVVSDFGGLNYMFKEGLAVWQPMDENIIPRSLGLQNIQNEKAVSRFEICFETEDIDSDYAGLKENNVRFLHEMNEELWGQRTVRFYDPDGHLIEIGESLSTFLSRVYKEEGSIEATAGRCFMTSDMVREILGID